MKYIISNEFLTATISAHGAELTSLKSKSKEYIWNGAALYWAKHSPVLFPIVGTLKNDLYVYEGKQYSMPRHGFARDCNFKIKSKTSKEILFSLQADACSKKAYPFNFELQLKYVLIGFDLKITYTVVNLDSKIIPFSIGAHPAFALSKNINQYSLLFEVQEVLKSFTLQNDLASDNFFEIELKNRILPLNYNLFANDALLFKTIKSKKIILLENDVPQVSIAFSDFKNLGIWTKLNAPFICLEPWLGYSDIVNHNQNIFEKEGIQIVKENCTFECSLIIAAL